MVSSLYFRHNSGTNSKEGFPDAALPPQLHDKNVCNILRAVDGKLTKDDLA